MLLGKGYKVWSRTDKILKLTKFLDWRHLKLPYIGYNQVKSNMSQIVLSEIEHSVLQLPPDEQLLLIARVAERLRKASLDESDFELQLAEMAKDKDIRRELREIESEFSNTELDGLKI